MKYAVIILGGGADEPLDALEGLTPLEAADTPHLDALAKTGRIGAVATAPKGAVVGDEVCLLSVLGYEPIHNASGHGVLEALSEGCELGAEDWVHRLNLVTVGETGADDSGMMLDHLAGRIPEAEVRVLLEGLLGFWRECEPGLVDGVELGPILRSGAVLLDWSGGSYQGVETAAPVDLLGRKWEPALASGERGGRIGALVRLSHAYLDQHEVNQVRREQGLRPANLAWIWGAGQHKKLDDFQTRTSKSGVVVTRSGVMAGIAKLIGWDVLSGRTHHAMGELLVRKIKDHDLVCWYGDGCSDAAHHGDALSKVREIEAIDRDIIGPVLSMLKRFGDKSTDPGVVGWRMLVLPDHATLCSSRKLDPSPVPFAMGGAWVQSVVERVMTERQARDADLHIELGTDLMEYFMYSGLVRVDTV